MQPTPTPSAACPLGSWDLMGDRLEGPPGTWVWKPHAAVPSPEQGFSFPDTHAAEQLAPGCWLVTLGPPGTLALAVPLLLAPTAGAHTNLGTGLRKDGQIEICFWHQIPSFLLRLGAGEMNKCVNISSYRA